MSLLVEFLDNAGSGRIADRFETAEWGGWRGPS